MSDRLVGMARRDSLPMTRVTASQPDVRQAIGSQIVDGWQLNRPQWTTQTPRRYDLDGFRADTMVFAAVQFISQGAASAPLRLREETKPGQYTWRDDRELSWLLKNPTLRFGGSQFIEFIVMMMAITGFVVIEKERNGRQVGSLWPLRSDWLQPIPRRDGRVDWKYTVPGNREDYERILKGEDVIHITWQDTPDHRLTGIGPVESAWRAIQTGVALQDFLKAFIDRGAMPLFFAVLNTEGDIGNQWVRQETVDAFHKKFKEKYSGLDNAADIMISPAVKDIKAMGFDMNQLAFHDLSVRDEVKIAQAFGIPPILLQAQIGIEHGTYSNYEQARRAFYESRMTALWSRIDDAFTRQLLYEFETDGSFDLVFDTSKLPALQEDQNELWQRATAAVNAGAISTHTYHRLIGIEPHGSDVFLRSMGTVAEPVDGQRSARGMIHDAQYRALPETRAEIGDSEQIGLAVMWFDTVFPEYAGMLSNENGWRYDEQTMQYVNEDGRTVKPSQAITMRDTAATVIGGALAEFIEDDANKGQAILVYAIMAMYLFGRGGRANVTADDTQAVANIVNQHVGYWTVFVNDALSGKLTVDQAKARAHLYGGSIVQAFDKGNASNWGALNALPYWPAVDTECGGNCRCYWIYTQHADGSRTAYWKDVHDSRPPECNTCWRRSGEYTSAAPFQLRGPDPSGEVYAEVMYA